MLLYGIHPVEAALRNFDRPVHRLIATPNASQRLQEAIEQRKIPVETAPPKQLDKLVGPDAVHQGVILEAGPLPERSLDEIDGSDLVLVLDQLTDPHNVGALLRSAAAFGAGAVIMQERHSPPLNGTLAKSASGGLDLVPVIFVGNLAQSLQAIRKKGFWLVGLAEQGATALEGETPPSSVALVLGAEGKGLRQLTRETCDQLCRISTEDSLASLNVSNAGAIALHWARSATKRT
ncbi:23S rRNA (guanosine(2251)-2'-O)-methyltransferase RlmB [Methyloligella sp. 2.7D]|nr:23S rRNA (guanosine(2251)-2'-O)-methyltransferase RlmB [Methyloligella sp. GL2]